MRFNCGVYIKSSFYENKILKMSIGHAVVFYKSLLLMLTLGPSTYLVDVQCYDYFQIFAKGEFGGGTVVLEVRPKDSVLQIKERIEAQTGVQPCRFHLRFGGNDLKDSETVEYYKIGRNSTVFMRLEELPKIPTGPTEFTLTIPAPKTKRHKVRFGIFYL